MAKTKKALEKYPVKTLVVAGGVAANQGLRERLADEITEAEVVIPPLRLCGDNAGMVSLAAAIEYDKGHFAGLDLNAKPSLAFDRLDQEDEDNRKTLENLFSGVFLCAIIEKII